ALGACFRPYRALVSLNTWLGNREFSNPGGCSTYTSSEIKLFKNALLTSI
ncbi:unnamed protein product, partial [Musa textilis]